METVAAPHSFVRLKVAPLTPGIGAEISGIDLACEQDDATIAEIRAALLAYKVVFFRDQFITPEQHIAFARRFGPLELHPATPQDPPNREVLHRSEEHTSELQSLMRISYAVFCLKKKKKHKHNKTNSTQH